MTTPTNAKPAAGILDLIVYSAAIALGVVLWAVVRIVGVFDPAGVAFTLPTTSDPVELTLEGEAAPTAQTLAEASILVPDLDAAGRFFLIASVILTLAAALVVAAALIRLSLEFRAGRFFSHRVTRALIVIGSTVFGAALLVMLSDALARKSAMEALGLAYEPLHLLDLVAYAPAWIVAVVAGVLAGAFAHGERLQRDTEGLV